VSDYVSPLGIDILTLGAVLTARSRDAPTRLAFAAGGETLTYQELWTETETLAGGSFEAQAAVLDRYPRDATVAVVGHEPYVSELLGRLLGSRHEDRLTFKKGGAALVQLPGRLAEGGTLDLFLPPKALRRLG